MNLFQFAEILYRESINHRKENLMKNDLSIDNSMNNLAGVLFRLNRLK